MRILLNLINNIFALRLSERISWLPIRYDVMTIVKVFVLVVLSDGLQINHEALLDRC